MKIIITEPTLKENTKSIGCYFIESIIKKNGYDIEYVDFENVKNTEADIYLFSVHHVKDIFFLNKLIKYKQDKLWIGGGHVMNHPYPFLHFFDLICVGEGEEWIIKILELYKMTNNKNEFLKNAIDIAGSLTLENKDDYIEKQYVDDISINDLYLNESFATGHKNTWYIEIARGCKSKCAYCELGWSSKYRENNKEKVFKQLDYIKNQKDKRVNIFAPDDFSCTFYNECINKIITNKLQTNFGSMRIDRFKEIEIKVKKNFLFRLGVDGLSERIRNIVNKPIKNDSIINLITKLALDGFVMFKFFMIFSYPFETLDDFAEFKSVIDRIKNNLRCLTRPVFLRIKFTPFIPNPLTPFENETPYYSKEMRMKIESFFMYDKLMKSNVVIINDGILEPYSYYTQIFLARCNYEDLNINLLRDKRKFNFLTEQKSQNIKYKNKILTHVPKSKREECYEKIKSRIVE